MKIEISDAHKLVAIYLSNAEKIDPHVQHQLSGLYYEHKRWGYQTVVYQSGSQNLKTSLKDLLLYNKLKLAELEVQQEKTAKLLLDR